MVHKSINVQDSKWMGGAYMPIETSKEHSIRKHREVAFDYTSHSHGNIVGNIE
ncbi:hypothetical protein Tco_0398567, partial [Tanacetum coccineum]